MAQVAKRLPRKTEARSANPSTAKIKNTCFSQPSRWIEELIANA
jgi:hypothetical protein